MEESWDAILEHIERFDAVLRRVIADGVANGEFRALDPQTRRPAASAPP